MADRYWVGNGGDWNDSNHWSATSGGSPGASIPTSADNVYFDANSFTATGQTVAINTVANCLNFDASAVTNNPTFAGNRALYVYGNFILNSGITWSHGSSVCFQATSLGKIITTAGILMRCSFIFLGIGGGWTLTDDLTTSNTISVSNGTFNSGNKNTTCNIFSSSSTDAREIILGSSTITITGSSFSLDSASGALVFNAGTSKIIMTNSAVTFNGSGCTFNDVDFRGSVTISESNTFNNLKLATGGQTYSFTSGTTQTVTVLDTISGSILVSTTAGTPATIRKFSGIANVYSCSIKDINATGGAIFRAYDSTNVSGNTGWTFITSGNGTLIGYANIGGIWKPISNIYCNVSDIWKPVLAIYSNIGGTWKSNPYLKSLTLSSGSLDPAFSSLIFNYAASIGYDNTSITVTPTVDDSSAGITVNGIAVDTGQPSASIGMNIGVNPVIVIVVTSNDGSSSSRTYTITPTRASNPYLSGMVIVGKQALTPVFSRTIYAYTYSVANTKATVQVQATAEDGGSITVNNVDVQSGQPSQIIDLAVGDNLVTVICNAATGSDFRKYEITITRSAQ